MQKVILQNSAVRLKLRYENRENGIPANEFIIEYFGEIYSPWRWFEKQDAVKQYLNRKNMKNCLPDFYNIMLEMHHNDPKGYNLLVNCEEHSSTVITIII